MNFNLVVLMGNLTHDPELRVSGSGNPVCNMRLAINGRRAKKGEQAEVLYMDIVAFGKTAEACKEHLAKGSRAIVQGRLRERRWEKDDQPRSKIEAIADRVQFLGGKKETPEAPGEAGPADPADSGEAGDEELPY